MNSAADIVIIGGGVMGLFTALALAEQRAGRIVVLEKTAIGAGSSGKSGAILRQHYSHETTIRMSRESLKFYEQFEARTGHDIGFRRTGMLFLCPASDRAALNRNVGLQRRFGVDVDVLDAHQLHDLQPHGVFPDDLIGALEHDASYVDPARTLAALAQLATEAGVEIRVGAEVLDVLVDADHRVRGVRLEHGDIESPVVINTAGPWAKRLCARVGVDLPLEAIRPEQAYFGPVGREGGRELIYGDLLTGLYWKPEPAGWTRVGKMAYDGDQVIANPDVYDEGVSAEFIEACRARLARRIPAYATAVSWGGCGALYTVTPDAHALIGPTPGIDGFFIVSGFSGHGFKLGPAVGRGVASLVTGRDEGSFDASFFRPDRFTSGAAVSSAYKFGILG